MRVFSRFTHPTTPEREHQILEAIRQRVIAAHHLTEHEQRQRLELAATLEALADLTGMPRAALDQIATEVRSHAHRRTTRRRWAAIVFGASGLLVLGVLLTGRFVPVSRAAPSTARGVFTTGLVNRRPVNAVQTVSLRQGKVYFYVTLFHLHPGDTYTFDCTWYDGAGRLLGTYPAQFTATSGSTSRWCACTFAPYTMAPGRWRVVGALNGRTLVEEAVDVTP
jgi:hypothetical protein